MSITPSPQNTWGDLARASQSFLPGLNLLTEVLCRRQIRRSYGRLSVDRLRDIGLTPNDLESALSLPLERSAAEALSKAVSGEEAKW